MEKTELLKVKGLKKYFPIKKGFGRQKMQYVKAVDNVNFSIYKGETFGLVGESGCGKSTTGRTLIRLYDVTEGEILYDGTDISHMKEKELLKDLTVRTPARFSCATVFMHASVEGRQGN